MIKHVAFTAYPVIDMARARNFYEKTLGLKLSMNYEDGWVEYHLNDTCFAITTFMEKVKPSTTSGGSIGFEVDSVDTMTNDLKSKGVKIVLEPFSTPGCRMVVIEDTEGNAITLHQKNTDRC